MKAKHDEAEVGIAEMALEDPDQIVAAVREVRQGAGPRPDGSVA